MYTNQELIQNAYQAFNARNIDALLQVMHPQVKWPRAWEGDYAHGHEEVRAYWERQWQEINPMVTPVAFRDRPDGALEVEVDQLVKDLEGNIIFDGKVGHVYRIKDGLIEQMDIETK
jgi:ketosteroid isomerase-like protein